jgi:hypothetical protein
MRRPLSNLAQQVVHHSIASLPASIFALTPHTSHEARSVAEALAWRRGDLPKSGAN